MPRKPSATPPLLKYVVGVDIAKDSFTACMGCIDLTQQLHFLGKIITFSNDVTGFIALQAWAATRQAQVELPLGYVLEATGVYYEELAYYLHTQQQTLSVLLPSKAKHFARSTELKSKTDLLDARLLCRLGLERHLPQWQPLTPAMRLVRSLTRERAGLRQQLVPLKNRVHAYAHSYQPDPRALARLAQQLALVKAQIVEIDAQLAGAISEAPELARKLSQLTSVPGIGLVTACIIMAETSGFALVENERQLASYAGLDVVERQSGSTSHATTISRRGNTRLRTALYLSAVSSLRYNPHQRAFYARLRARQPTGKPGVIAVMRKLLLLCYALWKKDQLYDHDPQFQPAQLETNVVALV